MKKRHYAVLVLALFIVFISVGYGSWSYNFSVINKITTYDFSALVKVNDLNINKSLEKDNTCEIEVPLLKQSTQIDFENTGTIPVYVKKIEVSYEGPNQNLLKKINYSGIVNFNAFDLSKDKVEIQLEKQDIYLEPKETNKISFKCKLSKMLTCSNKIFEDYDDEINGIDSEISTATSKRNELLDKYKTHKKKVEDEQLKKEINVDDLKLIENYVTEISLLDDNIKELTNHVNAKKLEKANIQNSLQKDKIKLKFFFERFNKWIEYTISSDESCCLLCISI